MSKWSKNKQTNQTKLKKFDFGCGDAVYVKILYFLLVYHQKTEVLEEGAILVMLTLPKALRTGMVNH